MLDMQTFVISYALVSFIFTILFGLQWRYHRSRYDGPGYWLLAYVFFFIGLILALLEGLLPRFITVMVVHVFLSLYLVLLFRGMEAFLGKKSPQRFNFSLLILLTAVQYYFTYYQPNPYYRQYNLSFFYVILYLQCGWLMLQRVSEREREFTRLVGVLCILFSINLITRTSVDLFRPPSPALDTIAPLNSIPYFTGQLIFVTLAFSLNLMLSRRLHLDLELDITMRKGSEKALRESEAKYKRLVEGAPAIVYAFSRERGGVYYSKGIESILGYSMNNTRENPFLWLECIHPDDIGLLKDAVQKTTRGEKIELDYRIKNQQGNWRWIRDITIGNYRQDNEMVVEGIAFDITSFKKAEEALIDRQQLYRSLFENNISTILMIEPNSGRIIDANPAAETFYGYSRSQLIDMKIQEINTLSEEEVFKEIEKARLEKRNYFNFQHRLSDGSTREVEVYSGPIQLKENQLLCSIVHDISEKKRAIEERERLIQELQEALQQVKTLSGLLPICASCKKIRDDKGYWNQLEIYFESHSEILFSHGICPQCLKKRHPKTYQKLKEEGKL